MQIIAIVTKSIYLQYIKNIKRTRKLKWSSYYKKGISKYNHGKKFKQHKPPRKYKYFICDVEGHYAKECKMKNFKKERLNMYQELTAEIDIVSVDSNDSEYDGDICRIFGGNEVKNLVEIRS